MTDERRGKREPDTGGCEPELPGLGDVVSSLRAGVPVRGSWRETVLAEIRAFDEGQATRREGRGRRRWTITPPTALAAALAFIALGSVGTFALLSVRDDRAVTAAAELPADVTTQDVGRRAESAVRFALVAPGASRVSLVGDFNRWDASATPMRPLGDGRLWIVEVPLPPGRHVYAFVVDGDVTPDPSAPRAGEEDFGVPSSVVLVGHRGS